MRRLIERALRIVLPLTVLGAEHAYVYLRWVLEPGWGVAGSVLGGAALLLLFVNLIYVFVSRSRAHLRPELDRALTLAAYIWLGALFLSVVALGAVDLARLLLALTVAPDGLRIGAAVSAALAVTLVALALKGGLSPVRLKAVSVRIPTWPERLNGFTVVQLSDVHIGRVLRRRWVESVVARANSAHADMIVITGDLIDGSVSALEHDVAPLTNLSAKHGVYFVTGNHEFYAGVDPWVAHLPKLGVQVLANQRVTIDGAFDLLGLHDRAARYFGARYQAQVADLVAGRDPSRPLIALAHQPSEITRLAGHGVDLHLAGHTHGGQIWPFSLLVRLEHRYVAGLYQHDKKTQVYVSRGTGFWGPPMRLFVPAEITHISLHHG